MIKKDAKMRIYKSHYIIKLLNTIKTKIILKTAEIKIFRRIEGKYLKQIQKRKHQTKMQNRKCKRVYKKQPNSKKYLFSKKMVERHCFK